MDFKNTKLYNGNNPNIQLKIEELRRLSNHSMRTYKMLEKLNTNKDATNVNGTTGNVKREYSRTHHNNTTQVSSEHHPNHNLPHSSNISPLLPKDKSFDVDLLPTKFMTEEKKQTTHKEKPKRADYEIQEMIGAGNFAKVFKAYNNKNQRPCALKILRKENVAVMKHVDHIINER